MLQKLDKDRLDKVLSLIESRKIKFPNATLSKELKTDSGAVSAYLRGKKPMSNNFYTSFIERYENGNPPTHERTGTVVGEINKLTEQVIQLQAAVNVYGLTLQHLASDVKGTQVAIIAGQIADAIASEEERLRVAWQKGV